MGFYYGQLKALVKRNILLKKSSKTNIFLQVFIPLISIYFIFKFFFFFLIFLYILFISNNIY